MNHLDLLSRALKITWRYKPLWLFGFILALCGGSGGGGNFRLPGGGEEFGNMEGGFGSIDPTLLLAIIAAIVVLILLLAVVGVIARQVSRAALIAMVHQITDAETVTIRDGWRFGWSSRAWRLFLVSLVIGVPLALVSLFLVLAAFSPLLLLITEDNVLMAVGIVLTVLAFLGVLLLLLVINAVITPIRELAWRDAVLNGQGAVASLKDVLNLIKSRLMDVVVLALLMIGVGLLWGIISLVTVLPISLIMAALTGGIPAALVYLATRSWLGAAIAGGSLGLLVMIVVMSAATGLYLVFQSAVWTLAYLQLRPAPTASNNVPPISSPDAATSTADFLPEQE